MPDRSIAWFRERFLCYFLPKQLPAGFGVSKYPEKHEELLTLLENIQGSLQRAEKHRQSFKKSGKAPPGTGISRAPFPNQVASPSLNASRSSLKQVYLSSLHLQLFPFQQV